MPVPGAVPESAVREERRLRARRPPSVRVSGSAVERGGGDENVGGAERAAAPAWEGAWLRSGAAALCAWRAEGQVGGGVRCQGCSAEAEHGGISRNWKNFSLFAGTDGKTLRRLERVRVGRAESLRVPSLQVAGWQRGAADGGHGEVCVSQRGPD